MYVYPIREKIFRTQGTFRVRVVKGLRERIKYRRAVSKRVREVLLKITVTFVYREREKNIKLYIFEKVRDQRTIEVVALKDRWTGEVCPEDV